MDGEAKREIELSNFKPLTDDQIWESELHKNYVELVNHNQFKRSLNVKSKAHVPDSKPIADEYLSKNLVIARKSTNNKCMRSLRSVRLRSNRADPGNYKQMGSSSRILPSNYGKELNSTKKLFRTKVYESIPSLLDNKYSVIDFDLKSCYNSILIGLYPNELINIKGAVEGKGL